jgi:hypothetical protein
MKSMITLANGSKSEDSERENLAHSSQKKDAEHETLANSSKSEMKSMRTFKWEHDDDGDYESCANSSRNNDEDSLE